MFLGGCGIVLALVVYFLWRNSEKSWQRTISTIALAWAALSLLVVAVSFIALLAGSTSSRPASRPNPTTRPRPTTEDPYLTVVKELDIELEKCYEDYDGDMRVEGTITNNSKYTLRFVEIYIEALNASGQVVGNETWYIDSDFLRPGAISSYEGWAEVAGTFERCWVEIYDFTIE